MIQTKLKNLRKQKGYSQEQMAKTLSTDTSNYSHKEHDEEWEKLANTLDVPLEEIQEKDVKFSFNFDSSTLHDDSENNITYSNVPDFFIETQKKYIEKLEEEIKQLKIQLK